VRIPRKVLGTIKERTGDRRFFAYAALLSFTVSTPLGVFMIHAPSGFIAVGAVSLVAAWLLGAE
jgi:hypothetical protein